MQSARERDPMRLTVLGTGTAQPQPDGPASGLLVESGETAVLLDCGTGAITRLMAHRDPRTLTAVIVGHLHGDHFLDLVPLRYLFPWAGGVPSLPVHVPPGARPRIASLAHAISERETFFDDAFVLREYDPDQGLTIGELRVEFRRARHYVPAWSMRITGPRGDRLAYLGDTGPSDALTDFARDVDLLICEATLASSEEDDVERGHMTVDEVIATARAARAARTLIVHYPSARRAEATTRCATSGVRVEPASPGLIVDVGPNPLASAARPNRVAAR